MPGMGKALEPRTSTVYLKGNRMATVGGDSMNIVDLDRETITEVNMNDKTWSAITFEEMRQVMDAMAKKMAELQQSSPQASLGMKLDVKDTGQTRQINGLDTRQYLMTIALEAAAAAPQQATPFPVMSEMVSDLWVTRKVPGYEEVQKFQQRMAQKLAIGAAANPFLMQQRGGSEAMKKMAEEMSKIDGTPVFTTTRVKGAGGMPSISGGPGSGPGSPQMPNVSREVEDAARREAQYEAQREASRATGGRLGGVTGAAIGGIMGRRRQPREEPKPEPQQQPAAQPAASSAPADSIIMETTQELSGFSAGPVSSSVFDVPTSFRQVEHPMKKAAAQMK